MDFQETPAEELIDGLRYDRRIGAFARKVFNANNHANELVMATIYVRHKDVFNQIGSIPGGTELLAGLHKLAFFSGAICAKYSIDSTIDQIRKEFETEADRAIERLGEELTRGAK